MLYNNNGNTYRCLEPSVSDAECSLAVSTFINLIFVAIKTERRIFGTSHIAPEIELARRQNVNLTRKLINMRFSITL